MAWLSAFEDGLSFKTCDVQGLKHLTRKAPGIVTNEENTLLPQDKRLSLRRSMYSIAAASESSSLLIERYVIGTHLQQAMAADGH